VRRILWIWALAACHRAGIGPDEEVPPDAATATRVAHDGAVAPDLGPSREVCDGVDNDLDGRIDEGCPIRLTNNDADDVRPAWDGHRLAWIRRPAGYYANQGDLFVRELPGGDELFVAHNASEPAISGDRVVYIDSYKNVQVIDLVTGDSWATAMSTCCYSEPLHPQIHGDLVAWSEPQQGDVWEEHFNVYMMRLPSSDKVPLETSPFGHRVALLDSAGSQRVAWSDDRYGHHTIGFLHLFELWWLDLADGMGPTQFNDRMGGDWTISYLQAFNRNRVVAYELHNMTTTPTGTLVMYGLDDKSRVVLDDRVQDPNGWRYLNNDPESLALDGDRMVVEVDPAGLSDLYLIDLSAKTRTQITDYPRRSTRPKLANNILVWQDDRNDQWELYMMDLTDLAAGDFHPEGR
jgi:beta propeller repeat protein